MLRRRAHAASPEQVQQVRRHRYRRAVSSDMGRRCRPRKPPEYDKVTPLDHRADMQRQFALRVCIPPKSYPRSLKGRDALACCIEANLCGRTCTSSLYTSTYSQLGPEFGASRLVCTLGLSLFVAGLGAGPMILSPLSEVRTCACRSCIVFGACLRLAILSNSKHSSTAEDLYTSVLLRSSSSG